MKKKGLLLTICLFLIVFCIVGLFGCNGSYAMEDLLVDYSKLARDYQVGDIVDLSVVEISASFNDGTTEAVPLDKATILINGEEIGLDQLSKITETEGTKYVEIKYSNFVKGVYLTVRKKHVPVLTGVKVEASDAFIKNYTVKDAASIDGLKVIAVYDGGTTLETEKEIALTDEDVTLFVNEIIINDDYNKITSSVGAKELKARYTTIVSANSVIVNVVDVLDKVVVDLPDNFKTDYKVGDEISLAGIQAVAEYRSGATEKIDEIKYYIDTEEADLAALTATKGTKKIVAKAVSGQTIGTKEIVFTISNYITGISLFTDDANLDYIVDDEVTINNFDNIKINVSYADEQDNKQIDLTTDGVTCLNAMQEEIVFANLTNTAGQKPITVSYEGKTAFFTVNVVDGETALEELTIVPPTKTAYTAGETGVTLAGLSLTAKYKEQYAHEDEVIAVADFTTKEVRIFMNSNEITDYDALTKISTYGADQTVNVDVRYEGKTASFTITVSNAVTGLVANTTGVKTAYKLQEDVDFTGLTATATLNYGTKTVALSELSVFDGETNVTNNLNPLTATIADSKTVTVSFGGQTADFTISVTDYVVGISFGTKTAFETDVDPTDGATYNFPELEVYADYKSGTKNLLTSGYTFTGNGIEEPVENNEVTVIYGTFTNKIALTVNDVSVSISVGNIPEKLNHSVTVNFRTLVITGTYRYAGNKAYNILQEDGITYLINVMFSLKNSDGSYTNLPTQDDINTIATKAGERTVRLTVTDNGVTVYQDFTVNVSEPESQLASFASPTEIVNYNGKVTSSATNQNNIDSAEFENSFFIDGTEKYYVGDDNPYKFLPVASQVRIVEGEEVGQRVTLTAFATKSKVYLVENGTETELEATVLNDRQKSFKANNVEYVVENYTENTFDFTDAAIGKSFKLSVLPDDEVYFYRSSVTAVNWTVTVVDGYNVTKAEELCLLEQNATRNIWDDIKDQYGLKGKKPASIILHQNTVVTKDSIPEVMYYTLSDTYDIYYKYGDTKYTPEDRGLSRTFLWDGEWAIFQYDMEQNKDFHIYGNFFDIDMSKMPLVAAFTPNGVTAPNTNKMNGTYYGKYLSKVSFLKINGAVNSGTETFYFSDFAVKGNSSIEQLLVDQDTEGAMNRNDGEGDFIDAPVYGGGLIFVKTENCHANISNIHAHSCFISYYSRDNTVVNYTGVKSYDTFLNGLFVNSDSVNTLTNCHMKRAGGPLILLVQGSKDGENNTKIPLIPIVHASSDCVLENYVTGGEQWFAINGANVSMISAPAGLLAYFGKTIQRDGKFNLIALSIEEGAGPMTASPTTQACMTYGDDELFRLFPGEGQPNDLFMRTLQYMQKQGSAMPVAFSVGTEYLCGLNKTSNGLMDENGNPIFENNIPTNMDLYIAFSGNSYKYVAINVGGMGLLTELFPAS